MRDAGKHGLTPYARTESEKEKDMTEILETAGRYRLTLEVQQDSASSNPRTEQDCNLANVITLGNQRRYIKIDEDGGPLAYGWYHFAARGKGVELFIRWARMMHGVTAVEENPHDGAHSIWYVTPERLAETTWTAEKVIEAEVREYQLWASGEVYGHVIEKSVHWVSQDHNDAETDTWEHEDSCWGYIGREYAEEAAREAFAPYKEEAAK
jgi:hypothetical protein